MSALKHTLNGFAIVLSTLLLCLLCLHLYVRECREEGQPARLLQGIDVFQSYFRDENFDELLRAIDVFEEEEGHFSALANTEQVALMKKSLFLPLPAQGRASYRYKPNIRIIHASVWNGLAVTTLHVPYNEGLLAHLAKLKVYYQELMFETDEFGFRKTDFRVDSKTPAILFLGDSFTEGVNVPSERTFSNFIGHFLKQANNPLLPINMGATGYGVYDMAALLRFHKGKFNGKVAVANLFPNDVSKDFLKALRKDGVPEERYQTLLEELNELKQAALDSQVSLIISLIPVKEQLGTDNDSGYFQQRVKLWCVDNEIPCLDPLPFFKALGAEEIYFSWDIHFSQKGHRRYAEFLAVELKDLLQEEQAPGPEAGP